MNEEIGFYTTRETAFEIALSMYVGEECQYCGVPLTRQDLDAAIVGETRRPCHKHCWEARQRELSGTTQ